MHARVLHIVHIIINGFRPWHKGMIYLAMTELSQIVHTPSTMSCIYVPCVTSLMHSAIVGIYVGMYNLLLWNSCKWHTRSACMRYLHWGFVNDLKVSGLHNPYQYCIIRLVYRSGIHNVNNSTHHCVAMYSVDVYASVDLKCSTSIVE